MTIILKCVGNNEGKLTPLYAIGEKYKKAHLLWKKQYAGKKIQNDLLYDLGIPLLSVCPSELKLGSQKDIIAVIFTITKL